MSEMTDRVKEQLNQAGEALTKLGTASKGLVIKLKEEGNKQFQACVDAGQAQLDAEANGSDAILRQLANTLKAQVEDYKGTATQIKTAAVGLAVKTRESGEKVINDLISLASDDEPAPSPVKKTTKRTTKKAEAEAVS